jgi:NADPH-dependent F420 reductase
MKIAILGTGVVGRAQALRLSGLGHNVVIGTQDVHKTIANTDKDYMGNPPMSEFLRANPNLKLGTLAEAAALGDLIINCLRGDRSVNALKALAKEVSGKILIDVSNPLDFSHGMPASLTVCNTNSLGEQIQAVLPNTKVVKAFNAVNAAIQVDPTSLAGGDHDLYICGNDAEAKAKVEQIARSYGWKNIIDLGDISNSRGVEMLLPMWMRLMGALKTPIFNFKVVK